MLIVYLRLLILLADFSLCHYERSLFVPGSISCSKEKPGQIPGMSNGQPFPLRFFHVQFLHIVSEFIC